MCIAIRFDFIMYESEEKKMLKKLTAIATSLAVLSFVRVGSNINISAASGNINEAISMRSKYEKHFENSDGSFSAFIDTSPIHYFENGEWSEIDNTIIKSKNGFYTNSKNSMNVILSPNASINRLDELDDSHMFTLDYDKYSISWDLVNIDNDDLVSVSNYSPIELSETEPYTIESGDKLINSAINNSNIVKTSSVWYKSIYDGCDINIEIRPDSIKDNTVINSREAANNSFNYYIEANGLAAKICDDNSIEYTDEEGTVIFNMPAPFMYESSNDDNLCYNIDVTLEKYKNGYILSYNPDKQWLMSDERNYPVILDPYVYINNNIYTSTLSEQYPTSTINSNQLKIGGEYGNRYSAIVSIPSSVLFSNDYVSITDAELYLYFNQSTGTYPERTLRVSAILSSYMPWWSGVNSHYLTELNRFDLITPGVNSISVTQLVNAWQNYSRSSGRVGVYPYGVLIHPLYNNGAIYNADSSSGTHTPYYIITYNTDTAYTFTYNPYKYNDLRGNDYSTNDICNFQNRMNCYAYALQIYDYSYVNDVTAPHKLFPGGLSFTSGSMYSTLTQLRNYYNSISNISLANFVEQQMLYDSSVLGMNLQKFTLSNSNQFSLPSGYNQNTKRIIAMNTGTTYLGGNDFHFYVRHGNGTCSQHGGTCSIWSHKPGYMSVSNTINGTLICDNNIVQLISNAVIYSEPGNYTSYNTYPRFYTIQLDTNPFNSRYNYNNSNDITYLMN